MESFDFFSELSKEEIAVLKKSSKYVEIPKNTILFYQDDICDDILYLTQGKVKLVMYGGLDEEIPLYTLNEGEQCIINTSSALSDTKTVGTAQTITDIKGWLIPRDTIKELMNKSPKYQHFVFSLFSLRFHSLTTLVEDIKFKRLDSRILEFLKSKEENLIQITHENIASNLGTSRVVVSRVLKDLENKNFIKLHRGKIEII